MMPQHMDATKENSSPTVALPSLLVAIVFKQGKKVSQTYSGPMCLFVFCWHRGEAIELKG